VLATTVNDERRRQPLRVLCLDGGGYLGLATAAFLAECERHHKFRYAESFDLFCGTSTGGLIALALAAGKHADEIVALYKQLGSSVFRGRSWWARNSRNARSIFFARYSNRTLADVLDHVFGDRTLGDVSQREKAVVVPAFCLTTGRPRVFKTDHSPELSAHSGYRLRDVALATSAAPTYFPVVTIRAPTTGAPERFIDGGICANNPALLAYAEALGYLKRDPNEVRILSVSTPRVTLAESTDQRGVNLGALGWATRLPDLFVGGAMGLTHAALARVVPETSYARIALNNPHGLELDDASYEATDELIHIGSDAASDTRLRDRITRFMETNNG
jgi:patatin-like phospholipase/acyl hydrolase